MKALKVFGFLICLYFGSVTQLRAAATVLIINQIRGSECCEVGDAAAVVRQTAELKRLSLPAAFALRYDALTPTYKNLLDSGNFEPGLFLEIIPSLARDAGVAYKGPVERWYKAENSYLLGYSIPERKRLIDTAMRRFHEIFGYYPKTTVAWMIDSYSLGYLSGQYGVTLHEITRDQWGTDSYTLYGGPVGPSYIPSRNWALVPAKSTSESLPLVMVRQTIPDPVWNYGDSQSVFTSQPNDYLKAGKGTEYFVHLLREALAQKPEGFAVVGLESSMPENAQKEFWRQLSQIHEVVTQNAQEISIKLPRDYALSRVNKGNLVSTFAGSDGENKAVWVNAPSYRLRIFFNGGTHEVFLSDARVYDGQYRDPYAVDRPQTPNAYWILPFTVDASRFFRKKPLNILQEIGVKISSRLNQFDPCGGQQTVSNEACQLPDAIRLPDLANVSKVEVGNDTVAYVAANGKLVKFALQPNTFSVSVPENTISFTPADGKIVALNQNNLFGFRHVWDMEKIVFTPWTNRAVSQADINNAFPEIFVPETAGGPASLSASIVVAAKKIVELGRNPIRIVVYLRDKQGRVASASATPKLFFWDEDIRTQVMHPETSLGEYYLDGFPQSQGWFTPSVALGNETITLPPILAVPGCTHQLFSCIRQPYYFAKWLEMLVRDRLVH